MSKSVIGGKARRAETGRTCFGYICCAVLSASLLIVAGCSDPVKPPDSKIDARLILEDGYAWVYPVETGILGISQGGYIFNKDGTCITLAFTFDMWHPSEVLPEWFVDGDKLSIRNVTNTECNNSGCNTTYEFSEYTYSFSDGKLILVDIDDGDTLELTKTPVDLNFVPEYDENLANTYWGRESEDEETVAIWMFQVGGSVAGVAAYMDVVFDEDGEPLAESEMYYTWYTLDGKLHLTPFSFVGPGGDKVVYDYSVSGDELTVNGIKYARL
jgi:hypothetical protein